MSPVIGPLRSSQTTPCTEIPEAIRTRLYKGWVIWGEGGGSVSHSTMAGVLTGGFEYTDYSGQAPFNWKRSDGEAERWLGSGGSPFGTLTLTF